jgi:error-prone DNA polymerase
MNSIATIIESLGWTEWLAHTNFSFLTGASHPHEMLQLAKDLDYRGIAFTDFDGAYGLARAHRALVSLRKESGGDIPLRLFHGAEIHFGKDHDLPVVLQDTLALVARSRAGYAQLCRLLTFSHREGKSHAHIPWQDFTDQAGLDQLAAIVPMRGLIRQGNTAILRQRVDGLKDLFGDRLYLAVSRHLHPGEDAWIGPTLELARKAGVKVLLAQDAFFHHGSQKPVSDILHAIRTNQEMNACVEHMFVNAERSLHSLENLSRRFSDVPCFQAALEDSAALADECRFSMDELRYQYPKEMIPDGYTAQGYLEHITWQAARGRYGNPVPSRMADLITHELRLIQELQFADYFLTVWDIVRWARERDILCQGRGSAANSAVCFVLGVTSVDPALFDLLFERFVSVERGDPPDIDVDFEHERREEVIQYIYSRYGRARAAMVANVITFRTRGAARAVGKALGVPDALLEDPRESMKSDPVWETMTQRIRGFPRHLGIHSGGFMLSNEPLDHIVPQEPATMPGRSVVQWCKEDIEALGFFKIDILALGMLSAVRKSFKLLETHYGLPMTLDRVPPEDPATYAMIQRADTVGTFQIESRAQMSMLPRLRPRTFYDLVIEIAIIRPGPIQGGMVHPYLRRRNGEEPVVFPDERLRPILARTLGIPIFQEQVMRIAIAVGDFTPGEANELRRHMGAWTIKGNIGPWLTRLASGMRKNGISEKFVEVILQQMRGFAEYGFPESHSASFAIIAYASSWLKCHYPAAFFISVLNSQPMGFYSPLALVQAARRCGVEVRPVCIQNSEWDHRLELVTPGDSVTGKPPVYAIRLGLCLVRGLREGAGRNLLAARHLNGNGNDHDTGAGWRGILEVFQVAARRGVFRSDLASLAAANAFAVFGVTRKDAFWMAEAAPHVGLMEDVEGCHEFAAESSMERVQQDLHATSVSLGEHPSSIVRSEYWCFEVPVAKLAPSNRLEMMAPNTQVTVFGMVLVRQSPPSAKGMVFYTLEDESGYINLAFTPQVYEKFERVLARQAFICVSGKLQGEKQGNSVLVHKVHEPRVPEGEVVPLPRTEAQEMRYNRCNQPESRVKPWISVTSSARSSR